VIDIDIDNDILTARISCYYNTRYRHALDIRVRTQLRYIGVKCR